MRYSFHGKVRATGQTVDGYVEAANSTEAIDRLADRGIIGVYSVRPDPKPPEKEEPKPAAQLPPPPPPPPPPPAKGESEVAFTQLADKLGTLLSQVEKLLNRPPQQVIYQTQVPAPVREQHAPKVRRHHPNMTSSSTLRDIFQTNLDLRQSLEKLANNTGTMKGLTDVARTVAGAADRLTDAAVQTSAGSDPHHDANGHESNGHENGHEPNGRENVKAAQPAA